MEVHDLLTPDEVSHHFTRRDRLKRQLVIWSGLRSDDPATRGAFRPRWGVSRVFRATYAGDGR